MKYREVTPGRRATGLAIGSAAIVTTLAVAVQTLGKVGSDIRGLPRRKIEMKKLLFVLIASACCSAFAFNASAQQADQEIADAAMASVKAQWAADIKNPANVADQTKDQSEDYTELNAQYATRLDGKAINTRLAEGAAKSSEKRISAEMLNPKVQVYNGDTAILTYNYAGLTIDKEGKTTPSRAKSTRVFVKKDNKWVLVHANFASDPVPKD
jgi:hypothetical protein